MKLMLGGGPKDYDGFVSHDLATDGVDIRYLPEADETVDEIHSHHAIEHVSWRDIEATLREWYRVLVVGGALVITFPDAAETMHGFLNEVDPVRKLTHWGQILAGSQNAPHMVHMSMLDAHIVRYYLAITGFESIRSKRVANDHNGPGIYMEAIKK